MNPWALATPAETPVPPSGRVSVGIGGAQGVPPRGSDGVVQAPPTSDDLARIDTAVADVERLCEVVADLRVSLRAGINALAEAGGA